jgi:hypothetical protein
MVILGYFDQVFLMFLGYLTYRYLEHTGGSNSFFTGYSVQSEESRVRLVRDLIPGNDSVEKGLWIRDYKLLMAKVG